LAVSHPSPPRIPAIPSRLVCPRFPCPLPFLFTPPTLLLPTTRLQLFRSPKRPLVSRSSFVLTRPFFLPLLLCLTTCFVLTCSDFCSFWFLLGCSFRQCFFFTFHFIFLPLTYDVGDRVPRSPTPRSFSFFSLPRFYPPFPFFPCFLLFSRHPHTFFRHIFTSYSVKYTTSRSCPCFFFPPPAQSFSPTPKLSGPSSLIRLTLYSQVPLLFIINTPPPSYTHHHSSTSRSSSLFFSPFKTFYTWPWPPGPLCFSFPLTMPVILSPFPRCLFPGTTLPPVTCPLYPILPPPPNNSQPVPSRCL